MKRIPCLALVALALITAGVQTPNPFRSNGSPPSVQRV